MNLSFDLEWTLTHGQERYRVEPLLFALLEGVREGGQLNFAARAAGVSYRHAWGLMRTWAERLDDPLILLERGRGASLTALGRALLDTRMSVAGTLDPVLERAAAEASRTLGRTLRRVPGTTRIASSHGERVAALVDALRERQWEAVLEITGSERALRRYQRGDADIAGFHLPLGELGRSVSQSLLSLLDDARDQVFLLERRVLGLMSRSDKPVQTIEALRNVDVRFVNRQPGSGTRLVIDGLLGTKGIPPGEIQGYRTEEHTHTAVAAIVASGAADAACGTAEAAAQFRLLFSPLVQERFYLCLRRSAHRALARAVTAFAEQALGAADGPAAVGDPRPGVAALRRLHCAL